MEHENKKEQDSVMGNGFEPTPNHSMGIGAALMDSACGIPQKNQQQRVRLRIGKAVKKPMRCLTTAMID